MKTTLEDDNIRLSLPPEIRSEIIKSLEHRIEMHRSHIKRNQQAILDNVEFSNIVTEEIERLNERKAKVGELQEIIKYCL
jgi:hypothetical protein